MLEGILTINFKNPSVSEVDDDSSASLILEQRNWNPYSGKITIGSMANAIANMIYDDDPRGGVGGGYELVGDGTGSAIGDGSVYQEPTVFYEEPTIVYDSDIDLGDDDLSQGVGVTSTPIGSTGSIVQGKRPASVNCNLNADGELVATVYAYPSPSNLNFNTRLTHGRITGRQVRTESFEEIILFRISDEERTSYPVSSMQSYRWLGDIYDENGAVVNTPNTSYSNNYFNLSQKIYGSLLVKYNVRRHIFDIAIPENEDEEDNKWDSVVYATFNGGVSWVEVRGEESNSLSGTECETSVGSVVDSDDDDDDDEGSASGRYTKIDYCSQDIISDHYS